MIHNSSKIAAMNWQQDNFIIGGHNSRNCMKGHSLSKVDSRLWGQVRLTAQLCT